jgi:hypothetical protein
MDSIIETEIESKIKLIDKATSKEKEEIEQEENEQKEENEQEENEQEEENEQKEENKDKKMIEKEECAICFDSYTIEDRVVFDCNHSVCIQCYEKLIQTNQSCPFCRTQIDTTTIQNDTIIEIDTTRESEWQQQCRVIRRYLCISFLLVLVIVYYLYIKK